MTQNSHLFKVSDELALKRVRAKYIPVPGGGYRLASVMQFSDPVFNPGGFVIRDDAAALVPDANLNEANECSVEENARRASRRAKTEVFNIIESNPSLDWFVTLTYNQEYVDRTSYEEVYHKLKVWLSNLVQRHGFKYVCVPEYHKRDKAIHWHMISNMEGLGLVFSGHKKEGKPIFNVTSWKWGFSTAIPMGNTLEDRDKVSKYIFKYMGKQFGQKIGGRYYLHGGKLFTPVYLYGDTPEEFFGGAETPKFHREKDVTANLSFSEWSFI